MSAFLDKNGALFNKTNLTNVDVKGYYSNTFDDIKGDELGFLVTNTRLLVAVTLGVVLVVLVLTTLKFAVKMFSRYYELSTHDDV